MCLFLLPCSANRQWEFWLPLFSIYWILKSISICFTNLLSLSPHLSPWPQCGTYTSSLCLDSNTSPWAIPFYKCPLYLVTKTMFGDMPGTPAHTWTPSSLYVSSKLYIGLVLTPSTTPSWILFSFTHNLLPWMCHPPYSAHARTPLLLHTDSFSLLLRLLLSWANAHLTLFWHPIPASLAQH